MRRPGPGSRYASPAATCRQRWTNREARALEFLFDKFFRFRFLGGECDFTAGALDQISSNSDDSGFHEIVESGSKYFRARFSRPAAQILLRNSRQKRIGLVKFFERDAQAGRIGRHYFGGSDRKRLVTNYSQALGRH